MHDASDMELLREYARQNSEAAFAELVRRHVNLVYSAALRHVGIAAQAEEITQAVFVILTRKAASLPETLILDAWLFETTRLTAFSFLRGERRRQFREQEAYMQSVLQESAPDPVWPQLAPLLDEAMMRLGRHEREAVVLRFFKGRSLGEVATALNIKESAAQKRVSRALEKLRNHFARRGVDSTAAAIGDAISAHSIQAAPVALAKTVTAVALAKGAAASTSTLTLIQGALKIMAWTNAKTAIVTCAVVLFTAGTGTVVVEKAIYAASLRQRLADGSVLVLNNVSFGDKHEFVHGGKKVDRSWPGHEQLIVEFSLAGKNATNNPLVTWPRYDGSRQFRYVIRGETGLEYVEPFSPPTFEKYPDGYFDYLITSIFQRDSKWLWFRVEQSETNISSGPWQTVAEFKVPNPAHPANLRWVASPYPVTNTIGDMDFVLREVTVEQHPWAPVGPWNQTVTVPVEVFDNGVLLTNWGAVYGSSADASGNWDYLVPGLRGLDPKYVWKLDIDFEQQRDFPSEDVVTVDLPRPGPKPPRRSWDSR